MAQEDPMLLEIPEFTVIIPTYGQRGVALTKQCLESLQATHGHLALEKLVISDGSEGADELAPIVAGHQAELYVVPRGGFAKACNYGLMRSNGWITYLVNNDITFTEPCLQVMGAVMDAMYGGIIGCRLLYPSQTIQHGGVHFVPTPGKALPGYWDHSHRGEHRFYPGAMRLNYQLVTGALLGISQWARMTIGGLDERFEFSCEDIAYGLQALQAGKPPIYCGITSAIHHEGATRGATPEQKALLAPDVAQKEQRSLKRLFEMFPAQDWRIFLPLA